MIVLAEDNEILNRVLEYRLTNEGYDVKVFRNGKDAVYYMQKNSFELLITDIYMPEMNGMEVIRSVRESISESVPILAISSIDRKEIINRALNLGANDFVKKPFLAGELIIRVKKLIG